MECRSLVGLISDELYNFVGALFLRNFQFNLSKSPHHNFHNIMMRIEDYRSFFSIISMVYFIRLVSQLAVYNCKLHSFPSLCVECLKQWDFLYACNTSSVWLLLFLLLRIIKSFGFGAVCVCTRFYPFGLFFSLVFSIKFITNLRWNVLCLKFLHLYVRIKMVKLSRRRCRHYHSKINWNWCA